ncbi:tetratricopeptide repeat protein [Pseudoalteromonas denitrificans]|uniref:Uncharacterized protein n=1 Tax=Pseudoalteromonas denitrificans DSM 6059 TaxID=1123010 RepID=A0A1I1FJE5_9GAMM|nr:tetratricopeptide repeat protein [Pseudoalteromonas denitrificans]SFB99411.1 Protein of unknown function [Pseudoalteromonas denitrificans DSM 6059]
MANFKLNFLKVHEYINFLMCMTILIATPSFCWAEESSSIDKVLLFKQANKLLSDNQMQQLLDYLSPHELNLAGNVQYDYLLGIALLDTKNASLAVQVLQRAIDVSPNYAGARLALARAYFDVGDFERAQYHFEVLQSLPPPENIANVIDEYLLAIRRNSNQYSPHLIGWIETSFGYDTNANAATADDIFLGFKLNELNIESDSAFASILAGAFYNYPINTHWNVSSGINLSHRVNTDAHFVDLSKYQIDARIQRKFNFGDIYFKGEGIKTLIDNHSNHKRLQGEFGLNINVNDDYTINLNTLYAEQDFTDILEIRDVDSYMLSLGLIRNFSGYNQIGMNISYAEDDAVNFSSPYSNQQKSVQIFSRYLVGQKSFIRLQAAAIKIEYDKQYFFFGTEREDDKYVISASYAWLDFPATNWQLTTSIDWIKHDSNVSLYQYDRLQTALYLRKTFN